LTGLLGINIGGIPGAKDDNAFYVFSLILIVLVTIQFFIFKRKNWI
jgi:zinc transporter